MPTIDTNKIESDEEDMEQDSLDSEQSSDDDLGSGSSCDDHDFDESELDEEESERRRNECLDDMSDLEKQFTELREQLCKERFSQVESKLEEVKAGKAVEYLSPLAELQENMRIMTEVAGILRELRIQCIKNKFESEELATIQNLQSEKALLYDSIKMDLEDKIRMLEEDRHNIDISSDLWNESQSMKKKKKVDSSDRRRKPVTVSGPYIVYMLHEMDIIEDWTAIKKAIKQQQNQKRKVEL